MSEASEQLDIEGPFAASIDALRTLIAATATWQAWCGEDNAEDAKRNIHPFDAPPPEDPKKGYTGNELELLRPMAIVLPFESPSGFDERGYGFRRQALANFWDYGRLSVDITDTVLTEDKDSHRRVMTRFGNRLGKLMSDIAALVETNGMFVCNDYYLFRNPRRGQQAAWETQGDFVNAMLVFEWAADGRNVGGGY